jgi:hypothetical protein
MMPNTHQSRTFTSITLKREGPAYRAMFNINLSSSSQTRRQRLGQAFANISPKLYLPDGHRLKGSPSRLDLRRRIICDKR